MINDYKIVALCMAKVHDEDSDKFITELNKQMIQTGYRLFVYGVCSDMYWNNPDEQGEGTVFDLIDYDVVDALIIYEERFFNKDFVRNIIQRALTHDIPAVCIGMDVVESGCTNIAFAYEEGFEKVVRHIVEDHGIKDVHFMAGMKGNPFSESRQRVFERVIAENGISYDESLVSYGDFWENPTREAMNQLIAEDRVPKAVICANDDMAIIVCDVLQKNGYHIPEDVAVIGFDGIEEIKFSNPRITSCACSIPLLAQEVAAIVKGKLSGEVTKEKYLSVPQLINGGSCGCEVVESVSVMEHLGNIKGRFYNTTRNGRTIAELSSKIQTCNTIEQVAELLKHHVLGNMCVLIKKECINEAIDPMTIASESTFGDTMCLLLDTDDNKFPVPCDFPIKKIMPGLDSLLKHGMPFIFTSLYFQHIPLGYVCFRYWEKSKDDYDRIPQIINGLNSAIGGFRNMRYQHFLVKHIEAIYQLDALAGLYNRTGFMKKYEELKAKAAKKGSYTCLLMDLDGLKYINDNFGHDEGDNAIFTTANALKSVCPEGALCTRFGGDEMFAIFEGAYEEAELREFVEAYFATYNATSGKDYKVKSSLGIYVADVSELEGFDSLIKKADLRMYRDKIMRKEVGK